MTTYALEVFREVLPGLEQIADTHAVIDPRYRRLHDELRSALSDHEMGTPAVIARVLDDLMGDR